MDMRLCEVCKKNVANIHLTQMVKNEVTSQHLCEDCARKKGISIVIEDMEQLEHFEQEPAIPQHEQQMLKQVEEKKEPSIQCPHCLMHFSEFKAKGRLGCAGCYEAFEKEIDALLFQVHGATQHKGKMYEHFKNNQTREQHLAVLRLELNNAIKDEKFELAAAIRDKIHSFKLTTEESDQRK